MDVMEAIKLAKQYVSQIYAEDPVTNVSVEETEFDEAQNRWKITLEFSKPWVAARTRAQEMLESLGATSPLRRASKVITISASGGVISMKDRPKADVSG